MHLECSVLGASDGRGRVPSSKMKRATGTLLAAARVLRAGSLATAHQAHPESLAIPASTIRQFAPLAVTVSSRGFAASSPAAAEAAVQVQNHFSRLLRPTEFAALSNPFFLQAPLTLHGSEGRYASALYCAAARTGDLDAVYDDMCEVGWPGSHAFHAHLACSARGLEPACTAC